MAELAAIRKVVRFGLFEADLGAQELRKSGIKIKIQEQPFQILALLLERPGEIVTREEIQKRLWAGDTFVDFDLGLNSAVKKLRQALGDESDNPRFVETLYRRGYRFLAPVHGATLQPTLVTVPLRPQEEEKDQSIAGPPSKTKDVDPVSQRRRRIALYFGLPLILLTVVLASYSFHSRSLPVVTGYREITHDGLQKYKLATDGNRVYLEENDSERFVVAQVSKSGGETSIIPTPFHALLGGILPDGSALLVGAPHGKMKQADLSLLPLPAGAPRRVGGIVAQSVAPSPDGKSLVFASANAVYQASIDGTGIRRLFSTNSNPAGLAVSPDGRNFCFSLTDLITGTSAIWEANWDGSHLHPVFSLTGEPLHDTSPQWTPDGNYLLFERYRNGHNNIWALPQWPRWFGQPKPIQITNGPLDFGDPLPSRDGKTIFVVGSQPRSELVRYDGDSAFKTYLGGMSITDVAFSSDGQWMTYVTVPDKALWRSRLDGSERLQLTDPGAIRAALPRWSPDGKQLVFTGHTMSSNWRAYLISSNGGKFEELVPSGTAGLDPNWMPDGKSIAVSLGNLGPTGQGISLVDLATRKVTDLPGSEHYFSPRPSPDGKTIVGITTDTEHLAFFDVASQHWTEIPDMIVGYPSWSRDGQYLYFETVFSSEPAAFCRMRLSDRKVERLASLTGIRRYWGDMAEWLGVAPDGSLLLTRDASNQEVYAIDWSPN